MIEPISIWVRDTSDLATLPKDGRQRLVNHLHGSLVYELGKYYHLIQKPSPGTLRVRSTLTEADGSIFALDTLSTFLSQMLVASRLKEKNPVKVHKNSNKMNITVMAGPFSSRVITQRIHLLTIRVV